MYRAPNRPVTGRTVMPGPATSRMRVARISVIAADVLGLIIRIRMNLSHRSAPQRPDESQRREDDNEGYAGRHGAERVNLRIRHRGGQPLKLERQRIEIAHRLACWR